MGVEDPHAPAGEEIHRDYAAEPVPVDYGSIEWLMPPSLRLPNTTNDVLSSLRLYFGQTPASFGARFVGRHLDEVLASRVEETDLRSSLAILTRIEAAFRVDYERRCQERMRDALSRAFRDIYKSRKAKVSLEDDIFEAWREISPGTRQLIGELRGAFKFRHWLAHGRFWEPKLGRKYDFNFLYSLADDVLNAFPFQKLD